LSYSRFSNSTWYTYWSSKNSIPGASKDDQIFHIHYSICDDKEYRFCEININEEDLKKILSNQFTNATKNEIDELTVYVKLFISDVQKDGNYK
jgi:hypothetical protein